MRAVRVVSHDGPNALAVGEVANPVPNAGQVLIDVVAAGVNFPDLLLTRGTYQIQPRLPFVLGGELAGVVVSAPAESGFATGDRVAATSTTGAFAEYAAVDAATVYPLPDRIGFTSAACLPMNYLTMSFALLSRGHLQPGESVLVHGAAGGIGTAAVQLGVALGAEVFAIVSTPGKAEFVRRLGATNVVLTDGFKEAISDLTDGRGVDLVVDPVGGDRFTDSLRCLAPHGRLLVLGFTAGEIPTVKVNRLLLNNIDVRGVGWGAYADQHEGTYHQHWLQLLPLLKDGLLEPPVLESFTLDDIGVALEKLESRDVLGKLAIAVRSDPRSTGRVTRAGRAG